MGVVKKYLMYSVILFFFVTAVSILLNQYAGYRNAYQILFASLEHSSIEVQKENLTEGEATVKQTE